MPNNKVQLANGTILMDITDTTAVASDVLLGKYFYNTAGQKTAGTGSQNITYVSGDCILIVEGQDGKDYLQVGDLGTKTITSNGTYAASSDNLKGYSQIIANVPNSYTALDEGKVVSSGALVSQSSATYTSNNTYDTTLINSVTVNVSGGTYETWTGGSY